MKYVKVVFLENIINKYFPREFRGMKMRHLITFTLMFHGEKKRYLKQLFGIL